MQQRIRSESGQVIPLVLLVVLVGLLGIAALVIDVGAWLGASRKAQGAADAAALAAAQDLPASMSAAANDAVAYATTNGVTLDGTVAFTTTAQPNDTVTVAVKQTAPVFFARILGISSVTVHGRAVAQVAAASDVDGTGATDGTGRPIPLVVAESSVPPACGCAFGQPVTLVYGPDNPVAGGQFGLVDFSNSGGSTSPGTIGSWISQGYPTDLGTGMYQGITGNKTVPPGVSGPMQQLAQARPTVLLPVYLGTNGASGGQMAYMIVGWQPFKLASYSPNGSATTVTGSFVRLDVPTDGPPAQYFGAGKVRLTG
jgi:Tfp pilus assembly protein PilV